MFGIMWKRQQHHSSSYQTSSKLNSFQECNESSPPKCRSNWSTYPVPRKPTKNCIFCHEFHWSHLCLQVESLENRIELFELYGFCLVCGKRQHEGSCAVDIWCKWPQCSAKNNHNTTICPNVPYPITEQLVKMYEDHVNYAWESQLESSNNFSDSWSQYSQKKCKKRNRKLSTNAKTLTFGCHTT